MLPAAEVAEGLAGYGRLGRGYAGPSAVDLVVHIVGDWDGRHFAPSTRGNGATSMRAWPRARRGAPTRWDARPADRAKRETYDCPYLIHHDGPTFGFSLRQESLAVADRVPAYILARLQAWKR